MIKIKRLRLRDQEQNSGLHFPSLFFFFSIDIFIDIFLINQALEKEQGPQFDSKKRRKILDIAMRKAKGENVDDDQDDEEAEKSEETDDFDEEDAKKQLLKEFQDDEEKFDPEELRKYELQKLK